MKQTKELDETMFVMDIEVTSDLEDFVNFYIDRQQQDVVQRILAQAELLSFIVLTCSRKIPVQLESELMSRILKMSRFFDMSIEYDFKENVNDMNLNDTSHIVGYKFSWEGISSSYSVRLGVKFSVSKGK
jgi:hypothetical protein